MAHELHTEIEIGAPPAVVWVVLTDLPAYPDWNPFITSSQGALAVGERLVHRLEPPGGRPITFKPTTTQIEDRRALSWLRRPLLPRLFDGRHRFELVPRGQVPRLLHLERLDSPHVRFTGHSLHTRNRPECSEHKPA